MRIDIDSASDPRVAYYLNLKDRELARDGDRFIAEGATIVRRLFGTGFPIESVLIAERRLEDFGPLVPPDVPLLIAPSAMVDGIIGFPFHSGVLAVGRRGTPTRLIDVLPTDRFTLTVLEDVNNAENLGSLIRLSAGLGADAMLLGERCADPFYRRSIRVSMGTVFHLPIVRSNDLLADVAELQRQGCEVIATVLSDRAEPLATAERGDRIALCFGSEGHGLSDALRAAADRHVTIPMRRGTDSLNVANAAAIVLHHFCAGTGESVRNRKR